VNLPLKREGDKQASGGASFPGAAACARTRGCEVRGGELRVPGGPRGLQNRCRPAYPGEAGSIPALSACGLRDVCFLAKLAELNTCRAEPIKPMVRDLIHDLSPRKLAGILEPLVSANVQPLTLAAKQFLVVASLQGFDGLSVAADHDEMEVLISRGHIELNRGLAPALGQPASFFARQFAAGPMYPGGVIVHGHGMYFAEPSRSNPDNPRFPRLSEVAARYATKGGAGVMGILLRCALKPDTKTMAIENLLEAYRGDRNRVRSAGLSDLGTYAAARGVDAFWIDEHFTYSSERTWNVVNRTALILQRTSIRVYGPPDFV
jgi:hypothetical protein